MISAARRDPCAGLHISLEHAPRLVAVQNGDQHAHHSRLIEEPRVHRHPCLWPPSRLPRRPASAGYAVSEPKPPLRRVKARRPPRRSFDGTRRRPHRAHRGLRRRHVPPPSSRSRRTSASARRTSPAPPACSALLMVDTTARATKVDWACIASHAGYYDQAHLIADLRDLIGLTPGVFRKRRALP